VTNARKEEEEDRLTWLANQTYEYDRSNSRLVLRSCQVPDFTLAETATGLRVV
jgi:hypothetical protein